LVGNHHYFVVGIGGGHLEPLLDLAEVDWCLRGRADQGRYLSPSLQ